MTEVCLLVASDSRTRETDGSGKALLEYLKEHSYTVVRYDIVPDDEDAIKNKILDYCRTGSQTLILTCGGTGCGPRDVTPEATLACIRKQVPGIAEHIRMAGKVKNPNAILSRGVAGIRNHCLIINLPGSPKGAVESLEAIQNILGHCFEMMEGKGHSQNDAGTV